MAKKLQAQFDAETETSADKHRESMIQQLKDRKQKILDAMRSLTLTLACIINYIAGGPHASIQVSQVSGNYRNGHKILQKHATILFGELEGRLKADHLGYYTYMPILITMVFQSFLVVPS